MRQIQRPKINNVGKCKLANFDKAVSSAQATINTALAITKTMTSVPYPFSIPLSIAQGIAGAAQVAAIAATPIPSFATGTEKTQEGPAYLHDNERILPASMNIPGISNADFAAAAMAGLDLRGGGFPANQYYNSSTTNDNTKKTFNFYGIRDISAARNQLLRSEGQGAF